MCRLAVFDADSIDPGSSQPRFGSRVELDLHIQGFLLVPSERLFFLLHCAFKASCKARVTCAEVYYWSFSRLLAYFMDMFSCHLYASRLPHVSCHMFM